MQAMTDAKATHKGRAEGPLSLKGSSPVMALQTHTGTYLFRIDRRITAPSTQTSMSYVFTSKFC